MNYKSLGSKAYNIGRSLGSRAYNLSSIGSKINPVSYVGNAMIKKAVDIGTHKLMDAFSPTNTKRIK